MNTSNKLWKDLDIIKPFKSFFIIFGSLSFIITFVGFIMIFFNDKIETLSKYKILDNFNLEFRYFLIIAIPFLFISIYVIIFLKHNLLKFRGIEAGVIYPNNLTNSTTNNSGNLHCVLYSNLGAYCEIVKDSKTEQFHLEAYCKITNISDSKVLITSIKFKDNYIGVFDVRDSQGEGSIKPHQVSTMRFWGYLDISLFKPKHDIITDVVITDNYSVEYILRNIRFRYITKDDKNK